MHQAESEALTVYRANLKRLQHLFGAITQDLDSAKKTLSAVNDEVRSLQVSSIH